MRGTIPPLPNTPLWRGAQLKHRDNFTLPLQFLHLCHIFQKSYYQSVNCDVVLYVVDDLRKICIFFKGNSCVECRQNKHGGRKYSVLVFSFIEITNEPLEAAT
jgi:hypothetical protein